mgnify:CR=1 FL=1
MNWMEILSRVLEAILIAVLPVLFASLAGFLVAKAKLLWAQAKEWNPEVTDLAERAAHFAVVAAEQAGAAKLIEDKKTYALGIAELWLKERDITIDLKLLDAAIEKAVLEAFKPEKLGEEAVK